MANYTRWAKKFIGPDEARELARVDALASRLDAEIDLKATRLATLHVHGAKSTALQAEFSVLLKTELGFGEEVVLTPQEGLVTQARPDFFFELGPGRGSSPKSSEAERRRTITI